MPKLKFVGSKFLKVYDGVDDFTGKKDDKGKPISVNVKCKVGDIIEVSAPKAAQLMADFIAAFEPVDEAKMSSGPTENKAVGGGKK